MSEMFPPGSGALIRAALGADPEPGPPYTHVHRLPETEEEMAAGHSEPSFTVMRDVPPSRSLFGTAVSSVPPFPVTNEKQEIPEAFRRR